MKRDFHSFDSIGFTRIALSPLFSFFLSFFLSSLPLCAMMTQSTWDLFCFSFFPWVQGSSPSRSRSLSLVGFDDSQVFFSFPPYFFTLKKREMEKAEGVFISSRRGWAKPNRCRILIPFLDSFSQRRAHSCPALKQPFFFFSFLFFLSFLLRCPLGGTNRTATTTFQLTSFQTVAIFNWNEMCVK